MMIQYDLRTHRARLYALALCAALLLALSGCKSGPQIERDYSFPVEQTQGRRAQSWFDGDLSYEEVAPTPTDGASAEQLFVGGEAAFWKGDVERAFLYELRLVQEHPSHPLTRFAAARLYDLRDEVTSYRQRVRPVLEALRYRELVGTPITAQYLSLVAQHIAFRDWRDSESAEPFDAAGLGLPLRWRVTPRLSPYRLGDFDRDFSSVEEADELAARYLSPYFAEPEDINRERTQPWFVTSTSLSPSLGGDGVYYMETFLTVEPGAEGGARSYWVSGEFAGAARVWLGGELLFERREGDYETGKRLRRVRLEPGTYRLLVKMAYDSGYRDWFDLAFLGDEATPLSGSGLTSTMRRPEGVALSDDIELVGESMLPSEAERVLVDPDEVAEAGSADLWLTALAAYYDRQPEYFEAAMARFREQHPKFAPAHNLTSEQIQTLWEVPSKKRDAASLKELRAAYELDPQSLYTLMRLGNRLRDRGKDREVREIFEAARDLSIDEDADGGPRLLNIVALNNWATFLEGEGFEEKAEEFWRRSLSFAPGNCTAASNLQSILHGRHIYPEPEKITPEAARCPGLEHTLIRLREDRRDEQFALVERSARRYPYSAGSQLRYARGLVERGRKKEARTHLETFLEQRDPEALSVWSQLVDWTYAEEGREAAVELLEQSASAHRHHGWVVRRRALLEERIPLLDLMVDGRKKAMESVEQTEKILEMARDDAFYVVDFAARRYFEDGSSVTLTHTVVRVMTKGAIDRYAETSIPGGARLITARTIKEDGTVLEPERTAGKSALSMPGLAEGDFVEIAYVQYMGPRGATHTHRDGTTFFFRMEHISSLHSEYVVIDPSGAFIRRHDAPEAESITYRGMEGVRFVRRDSPRPRSEPYAVDADEYLPWIQMWKNGTTRDPFEMSRLSVRELLRDSLKTSIPFDEQLAAWMDEMPGGEEASERDRVEYLFHTITDFFPDASPNAFGTEVSHAVISREGSPLLTMKLALDEIGIDADIYMVRPAYANPFDHPLGEFGRYTQPLLRVALDGGEELWLDPDSQDAMFGAIPTSLQGRPAVCVSCAKARRTTVAVDGLPPNEQRIRIEASLDDKGTLSGTVRVINTGTRAVSLRRLLRARPDEESRRKLFDAIANGQIPAATLVSGEVVGEESEGPLEIRVEFRRPEFARAVRSGLRLVELPIFRIPVASAYGRLADRVTPMFVGSNRNQSYEMELALPEDAKVDLRSPSGAREMDGTFGDYSRTTKLEGDKLSIRSKFRMPMQRVSTDAYGEFRKWAIGVEQSSMLQMIVK